MKNKVLVIAISLIAFFAFNTAQAQNAHFTDIVVSEDGLTISGKVAGLGNKYVGKEITITYSVEASIDLECYAASGNGQLTSAGQNIEGDKASKTDAIKAKNGQVSFSLNLAKLQEIQASCPGRLIQGASEGVVSLSKTLSFSIEGTTVGTTITL